MDSITLLVEAVTGHWRIPGPVSQGVAISSYSFVPPCTVRGFLESLMGLGFGEFQGKIAVGKAREPLGHGYMTQKGQVWSSSGLKTDFEVTRTYQEEIWYMPSFCIKVEGPMVERIRAALRGEVDAYGILSLGRSSDLVDWVGEMTDPLDHVEWLVPGKKLRLPVTSGRGFDNLNYKTETFDLKLGKPAWVIDTTV